VNISPQATNTAQQWETVGWNDAVSRNRGRSISAILMQQWAPTFYHSHPASCEAESGLVQNTAETVLPNTGGKANEPLTAGAAGAPLRITVAVARNPQSQMQLRRKPMSAAVDRIPCRHFLRNIPLLDRESVFSS
jgi:hypothetical protein